MATGEVEVHIKVVTKGDGNNLGKTVDGQIEATSTCCRMMDNMDNMVMKEKNMHTMTIMYHMEMVGRTHVMGAREP